MTQRFFAIICAALMLNGCGDALSMNDMGAFAPIPEGADVMCHADGDCLPDERCVAERCSYFDGMPYEVSLRMTYPGSMDKPVTVYQKFHPGMSIGKFTEPNQIESTISVEFDQKLISGTATLISSRNWIGLEDQLTVPLIAGKTPYAVRPGTYNITFFPDSIEKKSTLPVMYFKDIPIGPESPDLAFDISIDGDKRQDWWSPLYSVNYRLEHMSVNSADGMTPEDNTAKPDEIIENMPKYSAAIQIADSAMPAASAVVELGKLEEISLNFTTSEINLPPFRTDETHEFTISAIYKLSEMLRVTQKHETFKIKYGTGSRAPQLVSKKPLIIRELRSKPFSGRILAPSAMSPDNAVVTISAVDKDGIFQWKSSSHMPVSSDGFFTFDYPELDAEMIYTVNVVFENDHPLASESFTFDNIEDFQSIPVTVKDTLSGFVYKSDRQPLADARVIFTPRNDDSANAIETMTDEFGEYRVSLNHRVYDVMIVPPKGSGLANGFSVYDAEDEHSGESKDFRLKRPTLLFGTCLTASGAPSTHTHIEAFIRTEGDRAQKIASTETDESGVFRLFVPSIDEFDDEHPNIF